MIIRFYLVLATLFICLLSRYGWKLLAKRLPIKLGFNNEELPLLPLGAAAAKRYIYHRHQHQIITRQYPGFVNII